ncbi:phage tail tube protein [Pseudoroseomonas cervicalis]|uniref:phage tail tube protein n=1 Tax=Teichococcus cervicalis TaxID=204525 RepID=UPI002784D9A5|nr:phage tail tube protein [Pseudoroseomonas cervicalis]MDQ1079696.1 hypothetical protein [Pseudoroseomonas cervicalis]
MAYAFGFDAGLLLAYQTAWGAQPVDGYMQLPVLSFTPGVTQPFSAVELLGQGRDGGRMIRGLLSAEPTLTVPADCDALGHWTTLMYGAPTTTGTTDRTHVWASGKSNLPLAALERGLLPIADYATFLNLRANSMELRFRPGEVVQSVSVGLMGSAVISDDESIDATPTVEEPPPSVGWQGRALNGADELANITEATLTLRNNLEGIRAMNSGGPGLYASAPALTDALGSITVRASDRTILDLSRSGAPLDLRLGYRESATRSVEWRLERAKLELTEPPLEGRNGVSATFAFVTEKGPSGAKVQVTMKNQRAGYV